MALAGIGSPRNGVRLARVHIEFCETVGAGGRYEQRRESHPRMLGVGVYQIEHQHPGGDTKAHQVAERVELLAYLRVGVQRTCAGAVAEVKDSRHAYEYPAPLHTAEAAVGRIAVKGHIRAHTSREQIAHRDEIGHGAKYLLDHLPEVVSG